MDQFLLVFDLFQALFVGLFHALSFLIHLIDLDLQITIIMGQFSNIALQIRYLAQLFIILCIQLFDLLVKIGLKLGRGNLLVFLDFDKLVLQFILNLLVILDLLISNLNQHILIVDSLSELGYLIS